MLYFQEYDGKRAVEVAIIHNKLSKGGVFSCSISVYIEFGGNSYILYNF